MGEKIIVLVLLSGSMALGQTENPVSPVKQDATTQTGGFRLQNLSIFGTYYTVSPENLLYSSSAAAGNGDTGLGGSATISYSKSGQRSSFLAVYIPSYTARLQDSGWRTFNQGLSLNWQRHPSQKWTYYIAGSAELTSLTEAAFSPTALSSVASSPASFEDLTGALVANNFKNLGLASILTGAPGIESPAAAVLYGNRVFSGSVRTGLTYAKSSRFAIRVTANGAQIEALNDSLGVSGAGVNSIIPKTTVFSADAGISYSLSPRTYVSADIASSRAESKLEEDYRSSVSASLGRIMSERWFLNISGGTAYVKPIRSYYTLPQRPQLRGEGSLGYKTHEHTFVVSVSRSAGDAYGFGASNSTASDAAWNWNRPGRSWQVSSSFGQERLSKIDFGAINSWRATARIVKRIGRHATVSTEYALLFYSDPTKPTRKLDQHMVRVALNWTPPEGLIP